MLYVGKAVNLRRRLQQHAKEPATHGASKYARVRVVAWEELANDDAACAREADLIVALQPAQNASLAGDGCWSYLVVDVDAGRFSLVPELPPVGRGVTAYGCFPHLGKGQSSRPGIACSDGYTALLRLLWATGPSSAGGPYPRAISGTSPPFEATVEVPARIAPRLRRLLSGTSARLLDDVAAAVEDVDPYLRPALRRDVVLARGFFDHGPAALRRLRLRHGLPAGPLPRARIEALLHDEVTSAIGEVVLGGASERSRGPRLP